MSLPSHHCPPKPVLRPISAPSAASSRPSLSCSLHSSHYALLSVPCTSRLIPASGPLHWHFARAVASARDTLPQNFLWLTASPPSLLSGRSPLTLKCMTPPPPFATQSFLTVSACYALLSEPSLLVCLCIYCLFPRRGPGLPSVLFTALSSAP